MKLLQTKNIFFLLFLLALFLVFGRLTSLWSFPDPTWPLLKEEKIELEKNQPLFQVFTARRDNLSRVEFLMSSASIKPGGRLKLELRDETCSQILRQASWKVSNLDSEDTYAFRFRRLENSQGKDFCFSASFEPQDEKKKAKIFLHNQPPAGSQYFLNSATGEKFSDRSLSLRPGYQNASLGKNLTELNQRISQYKPWFLKHYFLSLIIFAFLFLSLLIVSLLIRL